jgi:3',5'-cyclic AMP phosphodiesterase CpdA
MRINRRKFLTIAGIAGLGATGIGTLLANDRGSQELAVARPQSPLLLRFAAIADTGSGNIHQYAVGRAIAKYHQQYPLDLVIMAGDNIYNRGEIEKIDSAFNLPYQELRRRGLKFYACLGNHDVRTDNGDRQVVYPEFNMQGQRYYTYTKGNDDVQFFVLETNALSNPAAPDREAQLTWLDRELGDSKARWKIVYGHHNMYSAGVYGINQVMVRDVTPILQKHQVRLWINGHDHNYQRSLPLSGTTYLVCGGGGATLYPIQPQPWTAFAQSIHSFGVVEVYRDSILISGIDSNNREIDQGLVPWSLES